MKKCESLPNTVPVADNQQSTIPPGSECALPDRTVPARRKFLRQASGLTAAVSAALAGIGSSVKPTTADAGQRHVPMHGRIGDKHQRALQALKIRYDAAHYEFRLPLPVHSNNGDELLYSNRIGSFHKGLPHDASGEVNGAAYLALQRALDTQESVDFERIPLGGKLKLVNPQAAYAFDLLGPDSHHIGLSAAPSLSSAENGGEMVELYWQALTRDIPFINYGIDAWIDAAAHDISRLSDFRGPKVGGRVTAETLFRGNTVGDLTGPYISQFLWVTTPYGTFSTPQLIKTTVAGDDFMTNFNEYLNIQNGIAPSRGNTFDLVPRYIRNGRDLGEYVHRDFTFQCFLNTCLILLGYAGRFGGAEVLDSANPYLGSATQAAFTTFGGPEVLDLVASASNRALKAAWFQKWKVHRRLRPEGFGGLVENYVVRGLSYPIHGDIFASQAISEVHRRYGSYLLPMAYPEGSPAHPAYPAGHAAIAGACVTIMKAYFNESFVIPDPVQSSADGLSLLPYNGPTLTLGGELNKLATNFAIGRDTAGVHWRSDGIGGLLLGEELAIRLLREVQLTYSERFSGYSLTKFDGTAMIV